MEDELARLTRERDEALARAEQMRIAAVTAAATAEQVLRRLQRFESLVQGVVALVHAHEAGDPS